MTTKLKAEHMLDIAEANITIADGVATINNDVIQEECFSRLDTSVTAVKKAYDDVALVNNTIAHAFLDKAHDYLAENKEYDVVTAKTNVGEEELNLGVKRNSTSRNPKTGEISEHKGAISIRRTVSNRASETSTIKQLAKEGGLKKL